MLTWGGLVVYGWLFILPLWGMAAHPDPGFSTAWTYVWLIGSATLFLLGWSIGRGANLQKYTFKRWPDRKFLGIIEPRYIQAGDRKILCSGPVGRRPPLQLHGRGVPRPVDRSGIRPLRQPLGLDLLRLRRHLLYLPSTW